MILLSLFIAIISVLLVPCLGSSSSLDARFVKGPGNKYIKVHFTDEQLADLQDMFKDALKTAKKESRKEDKKKHYQVIYLYVNPPFHPKQRGVAMEAMPVTSGLNALGGLSPYAYGVGGGMSGLLRPKALQSMYGGPSFPYGFYDGNARGLPVTTAYYR